MQQYPFYKVDIKANLILNPNRNNEQVVYKAETKRGNSTIQKS